MVIVLSVLGVIIGVPLIASFLMGKRMTIEKNVTINRPIQEVFNFVRISKNHDKFSVWNQMDPDMKREYSGTDGTVGFVYKWDSIKDKNVGAGEQETKKIVDGKSLEYELRFTRPMQNIAEAKFQFDAISSSQTKVQWGFYSDTKFPMRLMAPVFKKMLGKDLEKGLENLKGVMEK